MTTDPRDHKHDTEFEQDVEAVRSAWTRLENVEPPELLDQAVLNTAQRALETSRKHRPIRWAGALATAAVVVIALGIVVQQEQQAPAPVPHQADGIKLDRDASPAEKKESQADATAAQTNSPAPEKLRMQEPAAREEFRAKRVTAPLSAPASAGAASLALEEAEADQLTDAADAPPDAEAWIGRLLLLKESRDEESLLKELAEFRAAYPDYPLPAELLK